MENTDAPVTAVENEAPALDVLSEVASKIAAAHNILVALSSDPSVDEMSAAIGLSLFLDRLGKRATAIYSGSTPNALEFLKPEETFETSADTLQDFVIALNKEKADHLRYKLDGDFVKIFITPYRTRIAEEDLEFSYGDFNVDLVLALDVANGIDLDSALREHGRIMHDAVVINITTGKPGKFGEIEWSDTHSSSVSEMIARLLYGMSGKTKIEKEEATAFLTGIVAATNRFSSASTTHETMKLASELMKSGANQQLISKNITPDIDNELFSFSSAAESNAPRDTDPTKLDIEHGNEEGVDETKVVDATVSEKESTLLADLKAAEASLAQAGAETTPEETKQPLKINSADEATESPAVQESAELPEPVVIENPEVPESSESSAEVIPEPTPTPEAADDSASAPEPSPEVASTEGIIAAPEKVIAPPSDFEVESLGEGTNKYGQMLEDALAEIEAAPATPSAPIASPVENPALASAPTVPTAPEINGVPEINYMPMPGDEILPPPPTPPIDTATPAVPVVPTMPAPEPAVQTAPISPAMPAPEPVPEPLGAQPAMQDQIYAPQVSDPGAFKIPGM
ncbi:hypothetical protein IJJ49_02420 [Candidatus Saccharibacteria bacterium]|nr:hypothetical protein [Candidatus Saccharibacteria bacterium]